MSPVVIDTTQAATDTIQYVATDQNGLTATSTRTIIIQAANDLTAQAGNQASTTAANDNTPPLTSTTTPALITLCADPLFDHLVSDCEERGRHLDAQRPRRLQVDDELEFGRLQLLAIEDAADVR
jgi:hypothetical protein